MQISETVNSASIVPKRGEMLDQLFDLVLLVAVGILVVKAVRSITSVFAVLLAALGLVQTRHDESS